MNQNTPDTSVPYGSPAAAGLTRSQRLRAERRADADAAAARARQDADAASARELRERTTAVELGAAQQRARRERHAAAAAARRARRAAAWAALGRWAARYRVELLVYPLAVASAVMAVPAMAGYGVTVYGGPTGAVLPVLSELGMWAFALAVAARRRTDPQAPVWALQVGVWSFAAVGAGLNFAHGRTSGVVSGLVMAVASVAGVIAHQLLTAGALRPAAERRAERELRHARRRHARRERALARRVARIERAAVVETVAVLEHNGRAQLVLPAGCYTPTRTRFGRTRLLPRTAAGLPVAPIDAEDGQGSLAAEITAWLATGPDTGPDTADRDQGQPDHGAEPAGGAGPAGGVGVLDNPDHTNDTADTGDPAGTAAEQADGTKDSTGHAGRPPAQTHPEPRRRSMAELRAQFDTARREGRLDPGSAESIRKTLHCAPGSARALRDEHRTTSTDTSTETSTDGKDGEQR